MQLTSTPSHAGDTHGDSLSVPDLVEQGSAVRGARLTSLVLGGGLLVVVLLAGMFVALLMSITDSRRAISRAESAVLVTAQANLVENLTLDLETGERGFAISGQSAFLAPWRSARASYPRELDRLAGLGTDAAQRADAATVRTLGLSYLRDWSDPIVALASRNPGRARRLVSSGGGKRRVDAIRAAIGRLTTVGPRESAAAQRHARAAQTRALVFGAIGLLVVVLLLPLLVIYVVTRVTGPVRRLSRAADVLAGGNLSERVAPRGSGEIAGLAESFNAMADAIQTSRAERDSRERALHESERRLRAIIDNSPALIHVKDLDGRYVMANRHFKELIARGDPVGAHVTDVHPPGIAEEVLAHDAVVLARDEAVEFEERLIQQHEQRTFLTAKFPLRDTSGHAYAVCTIATDITERLEAEEQLRSSHAFLDTVLEHIPHVVFIKDAKDFRFLRVNRACEMLLGYSRDELIGKDDFELFPGEAEFFRSTDKKVLSSGQTLDIPEQPIKVGGGKIRYLHTKKIAILDEHDRPRYLVGLSEDITERKQAQAALDAARDEAIRANQAKNEFLSRISHELRTPLNAILGFAQILERDDLRSDQREHVVPILKAGRHLLGLINEVLDVSRIEAGTITVSPEPVGLDTLLSDAVGLVRPLADQERVTIETPFAGTELYVRADQQRLRQVLLNLLSNAIKYNRAGGSVRVDCHRDTHAPEATVRILISDTGSGIPEERLAEVFAPFERLGAENGPIEGTGLGLALSKGLVELMSGTLTVQSEHHVGSTFTVELAADVQSHESPRPAQEPDRLIEASAHSRGQILYIEDNPSNVRLVEAILAARPGLALQTAIQGSIGIDLARHHQTDVILLDLHLPDMSGTEVLRRLKSDPHTERIPVIILTADESHGQQARLTAAGAAGYISKPLEIPHFLAAIDAALASDTERT
jgi:PAS domain S-box-containing protein